MRKPTNEARGRVVLWSPRSLMFAACISGFALIGFAMQVPPYEDGPITRAVFLIVGVVATVIAVRVAVRRVEIRGTEVSIVRCFGPRKVVQLASVESTGADGPATLLWETVLPVVTTIDGEEIELVQLAGYEGFKRRNRRVERACTALRKAIAPL